MTTWRSQHYRKVALDSGVNAAVAESVIETVNALRRRSQSPMILSLRHLSQQAGVPYAFLRSLVEREEEAETYKLFRIRKRPLKGEPLRYRIISAPIPRLKKVLQWIDRRILTHGAPDEASVAFSTGASVFEAASMHCNARWLIKVDIHSFFETISERQVFHVFHSLGYQPLVAFELARLCTRVRRSNRTTARWDANPQRDFTITAYYHRQLGYVPQGAPTSPRLSNLVMTPIDETLRAVASREGLIFTRYADDLTFSTSSRDFSREAAKRVVSHVYRQLGKHGFSPNLMKTKIVSPRGRKVVLGLLVNGDRPRLQREFKARIRQHLYYLKHPDFGPAHHAAANGNATICGLKNHIQGLLAYAHGIEPEYAQKQTKIFQSIDWP